MLRRDGLLHRGLARVSRGLYRRSAAIISIGEVMTDRLVEAGAGRRKIITVHNWVPKDSVRPMPSGSSRLRNALQLDGRVALMYSGNLGLGHNLDAAVRAAARLGESAGLRLLFVGSGKMQGRLEALANGLRLESVCFQPPQPLALLADTLAAGDIHLVSQRAGTQGLIVPSKLYGVLAAGRPVLFIGPQDCEAARIVRESASGIIVPPGDVASVASALRMLARSEKLRAEMGARARCYYEDHFGRDRSVSRVIRAVTDPGE